MGATPPASAPDLHRLKRPRYPLIMSHRCHVALISDGQVSFHSDRWGALGLADILVAGPAVFVAWFKQQRDIWPDAVGPNTLRLIPEDFAVAYLDHRQLKISEYAGFGHWAERAKGRAPELREHLSLMTPPLRTAALELLKERWPGWEVSFADSPQPQVDWGHLPEASADEVWSAFEVTPLPDLPGAVIQQLVRSLTLLAPA